MTKATSAVFFLPSKFPFCHQDQTCHPCWLTYKIWQLFLHQHVDNMSSVHCPTMCVEWVLIHSIDVRCICDCASFSTVAVCERGCWVELLTINLRSCTITENVPTRAFSWLKAAIIAFTFKTLFRHYAKQALTPRSLNVKLGLRHKGHKGRAVWLA